MCCCVLSHSVVSDSLQPHCSMPGHPVHHNSWSSLKLMSIESVMLSSHLILCHPPAPNPSQNQSLFQWVNSSHEVAKYWSVSLSISPSKNTQDWSPSEWTGWISLQSKGLSRVFSNTNSSKESILRHSAFFKVQLSHPYMTTGKTIALTRQTFVGKVISLLFNMPSILVIAFLLDVDI